MSLVLNQIITMANTNMRECREKLEYEESGRLIASMQGRLAGGKELIRTIQGEFKLPYSVIEDNGEKVLDLNELSDDDIIRLEVEALALKDLDAWQRVEARIDANINNLKNQLLFDAEKSRELDLCQGQYKAQSIYKGYFRSIENEAEYRQRKREEAAKKKASQLPFDDDDIAESAIGSPVVVQFKKTGAQA